MKRIYAAILGCALAGRADTITSRDSRSWNGTVTAIQGGIVTLAASFPAGKASLKFGPNSLRSIEFNRTTFNPGAVPNLSPGNGGALSGTIYLTDKSGHACNNIGFDGRNVTCSPAVWPKESVLRIIFK